VDESLVTELETAIADTGALLVRLQKYRRAAEPDGVALLREALALGDTARRLHRRDALDPAAATHLLADARRLAGRLRACITAVRDGPDYRAAVAAYGTRDRDALARLLPSIFAGLEAIPTPPDLFAPVVWLRRGRLRPVADVASDVAAVRTAGLAADGDDLSPGADAELPAVALSGDGPADEPFLLRFPAGTIAGPVHRLVESGEYLVHAARVRAPAVLRLAPRLAGDEQFRVEISPGEYARYRSALAAAAAAAGVAIDG